MTFAINQHRPTEAVIHLHHLRHNLAVLRQDLPENYFFCPMVKANAYGHGDIEIALCLEKEGVRHLGVGLVEEGVLLRQMGVKTEILVFGSFGIESVREMARWRLTPVLSLWSQLSALENGLAPNEKVAVHVKFDTGMHRLGFAMKDAQALQARFENHPQLYFQGMLTHIHSAEGLSSGEGTSWEQLQHFKKLQTLFGAYNPIAHALNSAALISALDMGHSKDDRILDLAHTALSFGARPGLALYGYNPVPTVSKIDLRPVMSLRSRVVRYHELPSGDTVSYGATWKATRDSVVGVVPAGYADGVHRLLSNCGQVLFAGTVVPVVGNVCMDYFMIDVTDVVRGKNLENFVNQTVTLFGYDEKGQCLSAATVAEKAKTIPWEILTSVSERVPRKIENEKMSEKLQHRES